MSKGIVLPGERTKLTALGTRCQRFQTNSDLIRSARTFRPEDAGLKAGATFKCGHCQSNLVFRGIFK